MTYVDNVCLIDGRCIYPLGTLLREGHGLITYMKKISPTISAFIALMFLLTVSSVAQADGNLLSNGGFESGSYNWNGNSSLQLPNGWSFVWAEDGKWQKPQARVWESGSGGRWWRNGTHTFAIRSYGPPISTRMAQRVTGVNPGEIYKLTIPIWPEMVSYYEPGKTYSGAVDAAEIQVQIFSGGEQIFNSGLLDTRDFPVGRWSRMEVNVAPDADDLEIHISLQAPNYNAYNGFFLDGLSLKGTGLMSPSAKLELEKIEEAEELLERARKLEAKAEKEADIATDLREKNSTRTILAFERTLEYKGEAEGIASEVTIMALQGFTKLIPYATDATNIALKIGGYAAIANEAQAYARVYAPKGSVNVNLASDGFDSQDANAALDGQLVIQNDTNQGMLIVWPSGVASATSVPANTTVQIAAPLGQYSIEINGPNGRKVVSGSLNSDSKLVLTQVVSSSFEFSAELEN